MKQQGVIFKRLRETNKLTLREAAKKINKSYGWLSEIENGHKQCRINSEDYKQLMTLYDGEKYKRYFGNWITNDSNSKNKNICNFDGAIYKYLRKNKKNMTLEKSAKCLGVSASYLSKVESSQIKVCNKMKERILSLYGYKLSSFKNFSSADKRSKNIPIIYKLRVILSSMSTNEISKMFDYACTIKRASM